MASFAGQIDTVRADIFAHLPGRTAGFGIPFHQSNFEFVDKVPIEDLGGTQATGGGASATKVIADHVGDAGDVMTFADAWFERIHLLPRTKLNFGNIITQVQKDYELFSACRDLSATVISIVNNALPGTALPGVTPPVIVPPMSSILDATTTDNSGGTGLGTLVQTKVQALQDGLPTFDTTIIFNTTKNDPALLVAGTRIVLIPQEYEFNTKETLAFLTEIITALDGVEQRLSLRKQPRQTFEVEYKLTENDRQRVQVLLMDWQDKLFGFPLWHEKLTLTSAVSAGATQYPVTGADEADFRVGGLGVIFTDVNTFDVLNITAVTSTLITAADPSVNGYAAASPIMPLRTAFIRRQVSANRRTVELEIFRITFECTDNNTGALAGDTTPGFWSTYNSRVLLDDCNVTNGILSELYRQRIYRLDNRTGIVNHTSTWDRNKRSHEKGFFARNRSEILQLRKLLIGLRGRQKAFYIPTFIEDMTPSTGITATSLTMDITRIEYERFVQTRLPKTIFRITFKNGDPALVRVIQSVASVDTVTERLTLDITWPNTVALSDIDRVQFYELVRFDSDAIVLRYPRVGLAHVRTQVTQVFDDNT